MNNTVAEKLLQLVREIVAHEIDIITESDWFEEYIEDVVKQQIKKEKDDDKLTQCN
jgi:hypothetical protein